MQFVPLVLMLVIFYAFLLVPQRKKQKAQQEMLRNVSVGDEILTTGGIYGGVTEVDGSDLYLEIAPNIEIKVTKRAVADRIYIAGSEQTSAASGKANDSPAGANGADDLLSKLKSPFRKKS